MFCGTNKSYDLLKDFRKRHFCRRKKQVEKTSLKNKCLYTPSNEAKYNCSWKHELFKNSYLPFWPAVFHWRECKILRQIKTNKQTNKEMNCKVVCDFNLDFCCETLFCLSRWWIDIVFVFACVFVCVCVFVFVCVFVCVCVFFFFFFFVFCSRNESAIKQFKSTNRIEVSVVTLHLNRGCLCKS